MSQQPGSVAAEGLVVRALAAVAARQELALVGIVIVTVLMMVLPMPTIMADALIAVDIALALMLVLLSLYVRSATELSTLPSLILVTTAFRLSISITTSRLVLVQGDAGTIIRTFGEFVIAGNVVVGLVVYLIITVVQFVVITKGSERVAEVAARFNLDALPGKQMSIDTDVRNGDLTQAEARRRRGMLERESHLYGAMDGAMKFVKGDAIASLIIIAVNLIGGIAIGCLQRGLPFSKAVTTYSLLAVGDGLIAQVPALLVSLTAGLVVTRAVADDGGNLGEDIVRQVTAYARPLQIAGLVLCGLAFVPGFPAALFCGLGALMLAGGLLAGRAQRRREAAAFEVTLKEENAKPEAAHVVVRLGPAFAERVGEADTELKQLRAALEADLGIAVPRLRISLDADLGRSQLRVLVNDVSKAVVEIAEENGIAGEVRAVLLGCASGFVGIQETQAIVTRVEEDYGDLVREALKVAPLPRLAEVLRRLLEEQVSIRDMRAVLEAVVEAGPCDDAATSADRIRVAMREQVCRRWADGAGLLSLIAIEGPLETALREGSKSHSIDPLGKLEQSAVRALLDEVRRLQAAGGDPATVVLLTAADIRRSLQAALLRRGLDVPVLCHSELAPEFTTRVVGSVGRNIIEGDRTIPATTQRLRSVGHTGAPRAA